MVAGSGTGLQGGPSGWQRKEFSDLGKFKEQPSRVGLSHENLSLSQLPQEGSFKEILSDNESHEHSMNICSAVP